MGENSIHWVNLGKVDYDDALETQLNRANALLEGKDDLQTVYALEHPPTITIGRNGTSDNIIADEAFLQERGFVVRNVDRGGDVTYHGPGQLVLYPVLHLAPWDNDVSLYVRNLEESVIRSLSEVGIEATRQSDYPGVWVGDAKICAVGARVKKRATGEFVTYHGIALNVNTNLADFQTIVPCGIADKEVTSIQQLMGHEVSFEEWHYRLQSAFLDVFNANAVAQPN